MNQQKSWSSSLLCTSMLSKSRINIFNLFSSLLISFSLLILYKYSYCIKYRWFTKDFAMDKISNFVHILVVISLARLASTPYHWGYEQSHWWVFSNSVLLSFSIMDASSLNSPSKASRRPCWTRRLLYSTTIIWNCSKQWIFQLHILHKSWWLNSMFITPVC